MKKISLISILLVLFVAVGIAQTKTSADSLRFQLQEDSTRIHQPRILRLFLKVEDRYSYINSKPINMFGIMSGITLYEKHTLFGGYFFMDPFSDNLIPPLDAHSNFQQFLNLWYGLIGYQYVVHKSRHWQLNTPITVGYGTYQVRVQNLADRTLKLNEGQVWPMSAGLQLIYKPLSWVGLTVSGGYRYIGKQTNTNLNFKGLYYSFGLWIDGRIITRQLRYHRKKQLYHKNLSEALSN